jgi:predicted RecA/RadA family phage recombinase
MTASIYVQPGDKLTLAAPAGGVVKGRIYLIGALACVADATAAHNAITTFHTRGVFEFPKRSDSTVNFAVGEAVYWDPENNRIAKTNAAHFLVGCAIEVAANAATTVKVRLDGVATELVGT